MGVRWLGVTALVGVLGYLTGLSLDVAWLRILTKTLPVVSLAAAVNTWGRGRYGRWLTAGLLLCAVGDLLLELGEKAFLAGLLAFLAAHLAYASAFVSDEPSLHAWRAMPFAVYGTGMYLFLYQHLGGMALPVGVYVAAIVTMMWRAAARVGPERPAASWALIGAVLFGLSDTLIAVDRFRVPIAGVRYPIILLYWAGQAGIAWSARRAGRDRDQAPTGA